MRIGRASRLSVFEPEKTILNLLQMQLLNDRHTFVGYCSAKTWHNFQQKLVDDVSGKGCCDN